MLNKNHRLRTMRDFKHLFKKGRSIGGKFLVARMVRTDNHKPLRVAFIVSTKTEKSAVKRNRAKRQLREIVRFLLPNLVSGFDVALTIKAAFLVLTYEEKKEVVIELFKRARLLKV